MRYFFGVLILFSFVVSGCGPSTPTPDIDATIAAGIAATQTAQPTNTPTPSPTETPTPEPTETPTPEPTDTPTPTDTPSPTNTSEPTDTPTPIPTDTPTLEPTETLIPVTNTPPPTPATSILMEGLAAHWSFDDCTADDISGNGHVGTIFGSPDCVDGIKGMALKFDGQDDYIEIRYSPLLAPERYTIVLWYRIDGAQDGAMIIKSTIEDLFQGKIYYRIGVEGENIGFRYEDENDQDYFMLTPQGRELGQFFMAALMFDDGRLTSFINGQIAETGRFTGIPADDLSNIRIGRDFGDFRYFNGVIDEVRIYNRPLSESEIISLFNR